jgi:UDP-GlcNAc3NAcA epimerase
MVTNVSKKTKVVNLVGARPQFVKAWQIHLELRSRTAFHEVLLHTMQHYDEVLSKNVWEELFQVEPCYRLEWSAESELNSIAKMIEALEPVILSENPDLLIVYGDTSSTLAGALVAKKLNIRLAHIEAGVRNWDKSMPEEINRRLVDHMADFNFCVDEIGLNNLMNENLLSVEAECHAFVVGDIMVDAFKSQLALGRGKSNADEILSTLKKPKFVLLTLHRPSNVDDPVVLTAILEQLQNSLPKDCSVLFFVHPRTKRTMNKHDITSKFDELEPCSHSVIVSLLQGCDFVITDSGGLVRECYYARKKSLYICDRPVWSQILDSGCGVFAQPQKLQIKRALVDINELMPDFDTNIFGDGTTRIKIVDTLQDRL